MSAAILASIVLVVLVAIAGTLLVLRDLAIRVLRESAETRAAAVNATAQRVAELDARLAVTEKRLTEHQAAIASRAATPRRN